MKYVKILGLLAIAALALMGFASTASATTITSPTGTALATGSTIQSESEESAVPGTTKVLLHNSIANIQCEFHFSWILEHNFSGTPTGNGGTVFFSSCNSPWTITVVSVGRWEVHSTGGYNGTVTSSGWRFVAVNDNIGVNCIYETSGTDIGTLTGGNPATLDIIASIPRVGGSFLCGGANANWTGAVKTTGAYYIDS